MYIVINGRSYFEFGDDTFLMEARELFSNADDKWFDKWMADEAQALHQLLCDGYSVIYYREYVDIEDMSRDVGICMSGLKEIAAETEDVSEFLEYIYYETGIEIYASPAIVDWFKQQKMGKE